MDYNSTISVKSIINNETDDAIELVTEGNFYEKNGSYYILYNENEEMGMADCSVIIKVSDDEVSVKRKGAFSSKMIYRVGETNEFIYNMPYGTMTMILHTKEIKKNLEENGGELAVSYVMTIQEEDSHNELNIRVRKE